MKVILKIPLQKIVLNVQLIVKHVRMIVEIVLNVQMIDLLLI